MVNIVDVMYETSSKMFEGKKRALEKGDDLAVQVAEGRDIMSVLRESLRHS